MANQQVRDVDRKQERMLGMPINAQRILVINVKGGCGKTTVAINLASYYAAQGFSTALLDHDSQSSSTQWLNFREEQRPSIYGVAAHQKPDAGMTRTFQMRLPLETRRIIIDAPGGVDRHQLPELLRGVNTVLIPILPSPIDMLAVSRFLEELRNIVRLRGLNIRIGLILNRLRNRNRSSGELEVFSTGLDLPLVARLRDTQHYIQATAKGLGIHELDGALAKHDKLQWQELFDWLEEGEVTEEATSDASRISL